MAKLFWWYPARTLFLFSFIFFHSCLRTANALMERATCRQKWNVTENERSWQQGNHNHQASICRCPRKVMCQDFKHYNIRKHNVYVSFATCSHVSIKIAGQQVKYPSCTWDMIHTKIHLITLGCTRNSAALQCRAEALNTIHSSIHSVSQSGMTVKNPDLPFKHTSSYSQSDYTMTLNWSQYSMIKAEMWAMCLWRPLESEV